ncbi:hypothetical protein [Pseudonocardia sp. DLS-67]
MSTSTVLPAAPWPVPRVACDHRTPWGRRLRSTHQTSAGTVAYARCACGTWLVSLDGQPLATAAAVVRQQGGTND